MNIRYIYFYFKKNILWILLIFNKINVWVWILPFYRNPSIWPSFLSIFSTPQLLARLFQQYCPIEIPEKHIYKLMWQNYSFILRRLKNVIYIFFVKNTFISKTWLRFNPKYNNLKYQKESKEKQTLKMKDLLSK